MDSYFYINQNNSYNIKLNSTYEHFDANNLISENAETTADQLVEENLSKYGLKNDKIDYNSYENKYSFKNLLTGFTGHRGKRGDEGNEGAMGTKGQIGNVGEKGDKGDIGPRGFIGPRGPPGDYGIDGLTGNKGLRGEKGERGDQGISGLKGDKGDDGLEGLQGPIGPRGDKGESGEKGDKGQDGYKGLLSMNYDDCKYTDWTQHSASEGATNDIKIKVNPNKDKPGQRLSAKSWHIQNSDGTQYWPNKKERLHGESGDTVYYARNLTQGESYKLCVFDDDKNGGLAAEGYLNNEKLFDIKKGSYNKDKCKNFTIPAAPPSFNLKCDPNYYVSDIETSCTCSSEGDPNVKNIARPSPENCGYGQSTVMPRDCMHRLKCCTFGMYDVIEKENMLKNRVFMGKSSDMDSEERFINLSWIRMEPDGRSKKITDYPKGFFKEFDEFYKDEYIQPHYALECDTKFCSKVGQLCVDQKICKQENNLATECFKPPCWHDIPPPTKVCEGSCNENELGRYCIPEDKITQICDMRTNDNCPTPPCWNNVPLIEKCKGSRCTTPGQQCSIGSVDYNMTGFVCKNETNKEPNWLESNWCNKPPCWHKAPAFVEKCDKPFCTILGQKCGTPSKVEKICADKPTSNCPEPPCWHEVPEAIECKLGGGNDQPFVGSGSGTSSENIPTKKDGTDCDMIPQVDGNGNEILDSNGDPKMVYDPECVKSYYQRTFKESDSKNICERVELKDINGEVIKDGDGNSVLVFHDCEFKGDCKNIGQVCTSGGNPKYECMPAHKFMDANVDSFNKTKCNNPPCWVSLEPGGDFSGYLDYLRIVNSDSYKLENRVDALVGLKADKEVKIPYQFVAVDREGQVNFDKLLKFMQKNWNFFEANSHPNNLERIWKMFTGQDNKGGIMKYEQFSAMMRRLNVEKFKYRDTTYNDDGSIADSGGRIAPIYMPEHKWNAIKDRYKTEEEWEVWKSENQPEKILTCDERAYNVDGNWYTGYWNAPDFDCKAVNFKVNSTNVDKAREIGTAKCGMYIGKKKLDESDRNSPYKKDASSCDIHYKCGFRAKNNVDNTTFEIKCGNKEDEEEEVAGYFDKNNPPTCLNNDSFDQNLSRAENLDCTNVKTELTNVNSSTAVTEGEQYCNTWYGLNYKLDDNNCRHIGKCKYGSKKDTGSNRFKIFCAPGDDSAIAPVRGSGENCLNYDSYTEATNGDCRDVHFLINSNSGARATEIGTEKCKSYIGIKKTASGGDYLDSDGCKVYHKCHYKEKNDKGSNEYKIFCKESDDTPVGNSGTACPSETNISSLLTKSTDYDCNNSKIKDVRIDDINQSATIGNEKCNQYYGKSDTINSDGCRDFIKCGYLSKTEKGNGKFTINCKSSTESAFATSTGEQCKNYKYFENDTQFCNDISFNVNSETGSNAEELGKKMCNSYMGFDKKADGSKLIDDNGCDVKFKCTLKERNKQDENLYKIICKDYNENDDNRNLTAHNGTVCTDPNSINNPNLTKATDFNCNNIQVLVDANNENNAKNLGDEECKKYYGYEYNVDDNGCQEVKKCAFNSSFLKPSGRYKIFCGPGTEAI